VQLRKKQDLRLCVEEVAGSLLLLFGGIIILHFVLEEPFPQRESSTAALTACRSSKRPSMAKVDRMLISKCGVLPADGAGYVF